jgi:hypothetical protein
MENRHSVDQRRAAVDRFFKEHRQRLARGGTLVKKWRSRGGRQLGPYFILTVRDGVGRQRACYLGRDSALAADVRQRLDALQAAGRERRAIAAARECLRRGLAAARRQLGRELAPHGLRLHGSEVRGWSHRPGRPVQAMLLTPVDAARANLGGVPGD